MAVAEQAMASSNLTERVRSEVQSFASEHRRALQVAGLVAVAGVAGAVGGTMVIKAAVASKSALVANLALAAKSAATTKGGAATLPFLMPQATAAAGTATATSAPTAASLSQMVSMINSSAANGAALANKATALWNFVSANVVPLTAGVVGGGAAGVGVTQGRVRRVQEQLNEQQAKTESLQAETTQLQETLATTAAELQVVREQLPPAPPPPTPPPTVAPADRLERIRGIGPVFAQRLNEAGIYTLADLAAQTPAAVAAIIGQNRAGAMFDPQTWIDEARTLSST